MNRSMLVVLAILLTLSASCLQAAVIVTEVSQTPTAWGYEVECTNGWSIHALNLGWGRIGPWGPPNHATDALSGNGLPFLSGRGAFDVTLDWAKGTSPAVTGDRNPSQVWLGLDKWNGAPVAGKTLGSITTLEYYSFVDSMPQRFGDGTMAHNGVEWWRDMTWWRYVSQPMLIELTVEHPTNPDERRQLWYNPWGTDWVGNNYPIGNSGGMKGIWEYHNCLTKGKWYTPCSDDVVAKPNGNEICWINWAEIMNTSLSDKFPGTPIMPKFSEWKLVATNPVYKSAGWNDLTNPAGSPHANGSGKAINFHVGARDTQTRPLWGGKTSTGQPKLMNWVNGTYGFRGMVDKLGLGFNGTSVTYDFEPLPTDKAPRIVALSAKAAADPMMQSTYGSQNPPGSEYTQKKNLFKLTGKVLYSTSGPSYQYFKLEDGSNLTYVEKMSDLPDQTLPAPVWVIVDPRPDSGVCDVRTGDWVSVYGYVERLRFGSTPLCMWSTPGRVTNFSWP